MQKIYGRMVVDLKRAIGAESHNEHNVPRVDGTIMLAAWTNVKDHQVEMYRDMCDESWWWWRACEHMDEMRRGRSSMVGWSRLHETDDNELRVMKSCEALRCGTTTTCARGRSSRLCGQVSRYRRVPTSCGDADQTLRR